MNDSANDLFFNSCNCTREVNGIFLKDPSQWTDKNPHYQI